MIATFRSNLLRHDVWPGISDRASATVGYRVSARRWKLLLTIHSERDWNAGTRARAMASLITLGTSSGWRRP